MRPRSLADVARAVEGGCAMPAPMKEFVDELIWHLKSVGWTSDQPFKIVPEWIEEKPETSDPEFFQYLSSVAVHLAMLAVLPVPEWSLKVPYKRFSYEHFQKLWQTFP